MPHVAHNPSACHVALGIQQLRDVLGVSLVYDLRSDTEMHKYDTPIPEMEGVDVIHVPVFKKEDYSPEAMAKCVWPPNDLPQAQTQSAL